MHYKSRGYLPLLHTERHELLSKVEWVKMLEMVKEDTVEASRWEEVEFLTEAAICHTQNTFLVMVTLVTVA